MTKPSFGEVIVTTPVAELLAEGPGPATDISKPAATTTQAKAYLLIDMTFSSL
jgi:hypothetical protein